ncbi:Lon protease [Pseudoclavibacter sp. CFCC 14310]|nr:Lon protease [Pseudoclavibacter sp. CFCC 14310]
MDSQGKPWRPPWCSSQRYTSVIHAMPIARHRLSRLATIVAAGALIICAFTPSPYVIREEGPAYDVLGTVTDEGQTETKTVLDITGAPTYPTTGSLYMLTVRVLGSPRAQPNWVQTASAWVDPTRTVLPLDAVYPPGQTFDDQERETTEQMTTSQQAAVDAALNHLGLEDAESKPQVQISLDKVGGPSAGMMFSLGIIDKLTPGSMTGGETIAGTGTIDAAGHVGPIGGIRQKVLTARDHGAPWFLVPEANCAELAGGIPDSVTVVSVASLDDALHALDTISTTKSVAGLPQCAR